MPEPLPTLLCAVSRHESSLSLCIIVDALWHVVAVPPTAEPSRPLWALMHVLSLSWMAQSVAHACACVRCHEDAITFCQATLPLLVLSADMVAEAAAQVWQKREPSQSKLACLPIPPSTL